MGLRFKFTLAISALTAAVLCFSVLFYYLMQRNLHERNLTIQQDDIANSLAHIASEAVLVQDDLLAQHFSEYLKKSNPSVLFCYVSSHGRIIAHSDRSYISTPVSRFRYDERETIVLSKALSVGSTPVRVVVGFSEKVLDENLEHLRAQLFSGFVNILLFSLVLGYAASFLLASSLTRPVEQMARVIKTAGGGNLGVRINLHRRDEIGYLADEFDSMLARLNELERMKEDFVSAVTHELKSPLSAIESYLDLMLYEIKVERCPPAKFEADIKYVKKNTSRLFRFISDVLDAGKINSGKFSIKKAPFPVEALAAEVLTLFKERADSLRITLAGPDADARTLVMADEERIRQVLTNLVSNSLKFTPEGGTVSVSVRQPDEGDSHVTVCVDDTGVGIPETDRVRLFGLFEQGRNAPLHTKSPKGTGLGLFIAKSIVAAHGGVIRAESGGGKGTRIYFTLDTATEEVSDG